jgi:hypothetical protein
VRRAASVISAPEVDHLPAYWQFHEAVARAQLTTWLPAGRHVLVDVSGPRASSAELAAGAGHTVLRVLDEPPPGRPPDQAAVMAGGPALGPAALTPGTRDPGATAAPTMEPGQGRTVPGRGARPVRQTGSPGRIIRLAADPASLSFLRDGCADGVIADDRVLSVHLAAETIVAEIARVLRPGGRVLACVDSLVLGMAVLAAQHHWAHLVDLPHAEVVLVPWPDGSITRCYGPDQARELFGGAGLRVKRIRPRTVFSESMVTHVLRHDPNSLPRLVQAELAAAADESLGAQLVISAGKPRSHRG